MDIVDAELVPGPPVDPVIQALMGDISTPEAMSPYMRTFIYGSMDSGKTTFALGAPQNLIINADQGLASAYAEVAAQYMGRWRPMKFKSIAQLEALVSSLERGWFPEYHTITVDKITDVSHAGIREITERQAAMSGRNPNVFETDDRVEIGERIRALMHRLRSLDRHLVVIAAAKTLEPKNKPAITMPEFSERMVGTLGGMFDVVGYMYKEDDGTGQVHHYMRVAGITGYIARTRIDGLPPVILNPTWDGLFAKYQEMRERALAQIQQFQH